jgi:hypothetical protein
VFIEVNTGTIVHDQAEPRIVGAAAGEHWLEASSVWIGAQLLITDASGRMVASGTLLDDRTPLRLPAADGLYQVKLQGPHASWAGRAMQITR